MCISDVSSEKSWLWKKLVAEVNVFDFEESETGLSSTASDKKDAKDFCTFWKKRGGLMMNT